MKVTVTSAKPDTSPTRLSFDEAKQKRGVFIPVGVQIEKDTPTRLIFVSNDVVLYTRVKNITGLAPADASWNNPKFKFVPDEHPLTITLAND